MVTNSTPEEGVETSNKRHSSNTICPRNKNDASMMAVVMAAHDNGREHASARETAPAGASLNMNGSLHVPSVAVPSVLFHGSLSIDHHGGGRARNDGSHTSTTEQHQQQHHCSTSVARLPVSRQGEDKILNPNDVRCTRGDTDKLDANASPAHSSLGTFETVRLTDHVVGSETEQMPLNSVVTTQQGSSSREGESKETCCATTTTTNFLPVISDPGLTDATREYEEGQRRDSHITDQNTSLVATATSLLPPHSSQDIATTSADTSGTKPLVEIAPKEFIESQEKSTSASTRPVSILNAKPTSVEQGSPQQPSSATPSTIVLKSLPGTVAGSRIKIESPRKQESQGQDTIDMSISSTTPSSDSANQAVSSENSSNVKSPPSNKGKRKRSFSGSLQMGQTSGRWTSEEHQAFLEGLKECGREWKKVAMRIPTRTSAQIRSHAQKYFAKLQRDHENHHHLLTTQSVNGAPNGSPQDSPASVVVGEGGLLTGSTIATHPPNTLAPSVQRNVQRIIADPRAAQQEVENTLEALRQRYRQLQERLEARRNRRRYRLGERSDGGHGSNRGHAPPSSAVAAMYIQDSRLSRKRFLESPSHHGLAGTGADENSSVSSNVSSVAASRGDLGNEEIIALQVLGDDLPRGDSSVEDATSTTAMATAELEDESVANGNHQNDLMEIDEPSSVQGPKNDDVQDVQKNN